MVTIVAAVHCAVRTVVMVMAAVNCALRTLVMVVAAVEFALRTVVVAVAAVHCALRSVVMVVAAVHCALRTVVMVVRLSSRFSSNSLVSGATGGHSALFQLSVVCFVAPCILTKRPAFCSFGSLTLQTANLHGSHLITTSSSNTYLLTCLLTPWSGVHLEKLTCSQLVKKNLAFYGTRMLITIFTRSLHVSLP